MMTVYTAISDLLFLHDTVVVPGLGTFRCQSQGAQVNVITNQFVRPTMEVSFGSDYDPEDERLANYLCEQNQLAKNEVDDMLGQFVAELNNALQEGEEVSFPDIGALSLDQEGEYAFQPNESILTDGDAFGLGDFIPTPVAAAETKNDWKKRLAEEQRDKDTKMTVDKEAMYVEDQEELEALRRHRRKRVRRAALLALLGLLLVLALLVYLKVIDVSFVKKYFIAQQTPPVTKTVEFHADPELLAQMVSYYPPPKLEQEAVEQEKLEEEKPEEEKPEVEKPEVVESQPVEEVRGTVVAASAEWDERYAPAPTSKYFIVGGFFAEKDNALNLARSLFNEGYTHAFIYPAGSKYYTCYGHYETKEEAKSALEEVKKTNPKAWLYERKKTS